MPPHLILKDFAMKNILLAFVLGIAAVWLFGDQLRQMATTIRLPVKSTQSDGAASSSNATGSVFKRARSVPEPQQQPLPPTSEKSTPPVDSAATEALVKPLVARIEKLESTTEAIVRNQEYLLKNFDTSPLVSEIEKLEKRLRNLEHERTGFETSTAKSFETLSAKLDKLALETKPQSSENRPPSVQTTTNFRGNQSLPVKTPKRPIPSAPVASIGFCDSPRHPKVVQLRFPCGTTVQNVLVSVPGVHVACPHGCGTYFFRHPQ